MILVHWRDQVTKHSTDSYASFDFLPGGVLVVHGAPWDEPDHYYSPNFWDHVEVTP